MTIGPVEFLAPSWLVLIPVLGAAVVWLARRSLAGLGGSSKWVAIAARVLVITGLCAALARPQWRTPADHVAVLAVRDISRSVSPQFQVLVDDYLARAKRANQESGQREDTLGVITAARDAALQALPSTLTDPARRGTTGDLAGTDLAEGVLLALASINQDAAPRIVLFTDGNETAGSLEAAAEQARALGVPIDVLPHEFSYAREVIVERLVTPATARGGETVNLSVVLTATAPTRGRLIIKQNDAEIDISPGEPGNSAIIELEQGTNVVSRPVELPRPGAQRFEAFFEPLAGEEGADALVENNRALGVTFVGAEGLVLIVASDERESGPLAEALADSRIEARVIDAADLPGDLTQLSEFEAIVLLNQPAFNFDASEQDLLRQYVHDAGGGLVMIGGPDSFGAGGWIGSPLEAALPLELDPPSQRNMPRGALVLLIHSVEHPQGVFLGKQAAQLASDALGRLDLVGIVEADFSKPSTVGWPFDLQVKGDGVEVARAINKLTFGDMNDFDPSLRETFTKLRTANAGQKHAIIISDGDPQVSKGLIGQFADAKIGLTTIAISWHQPSDLARLKQMSDRTGGRHFAIDPDQAAKQLPQLIVKEAQTVKRSLIWEGEGFQPTVLNTGAESMRGISAVPPISGYVVTTPRRGGTARVTLLRRQEDGPGDPISAQWQHGLGRVVAFTSDATARWNGAWIAWDGYRQFWEQHVRWAMRPTGSATMRVTTDNRGDETVVYVDAFDAEGNRLNFAQFDSRVATPDGTGAPLELRQVGPGRYEGRFDSSAAGNYLVSARYAAVAGEGSAPGERLEGTVQAAVSRPFADEFRALRSNTLLLQRVADLTGGRILSGEPAADELWRRDGLKIPVRSEPIWLAVAIAAMSLFLVDVAVRRVRIDPAMVAAGFRSLFRPTPKAMKTQVDALRAAKAKSADRTAGGRGAEAPGAPAPREVARRKFEAAEGTAAPTGPVALSGQASPGERPKAQAPKPGEHEDAISRLRRARERARDEFTDDDTPKA